MRNSIVTDDLNQIIKSDLPWGNLKGQTVLITGANGFLPAYMVDTLSFLNEEVFTDYVNIIALVRNKENGMKRFKDYLGKSYFKLIVQDVCEPYITDENIDYIVHAASQASPKYFGTDPVGTLSANVIGTMNLLNLARQKKVKSFLFFSSAEIYGELDEEFIPTKEFNYGIIDPMNVRSCYAESKRMGETMSVSWLQQFGVPAKIVRPFHTYGPGMSLTDGRVFADFVKNIVEGNHIIMKSEGTSSRAFCYLADATRGYFTVLLKGENGQAYNIGNKECEITISKLAETLVGLFPEKELRVIKEIRNDQYLQSLVNRSCPDISKSRLLGWEPIYGLEEGFRRTILSFHELILI